MRTLLLSFLLACILSGCKKDSNNTFLEADATVIDEGSPAYDGCGWWLILDNNQSYSPDNLPEKYKVAGTSLHIKYQLTEHTNSCSIPVNSPNYKAIPNVIHLQSVKGN